VRYHAQLAARAGPGGIVADPLLSSVSKQPPSHQRLPLQEQKCDARPTILVMCGAPQLYALLVFTNPDIEAILDSFNHRSTLVNRPVIGQASLGHVAK
jgi:hypothetical protein